MLRATPDARDTVTANARCRSGRQPVSQGAARLIAQRGMPMKLAFVIPAYNEEALIGKCLE